VLLLRGPDFFAQAAEKMADNSAIEWTDATWNPIRARRLVPGADPGDFATVTAIGWHCEHVSEGCRNCYAERMNRRLGTRLDYKPGHLKQGEIDIYLDHRMLSQPLRWKRPRDIFVLSMTDLFAPFVPFAMIDRIMAAMAAAPWHRFQVLTKRPERAVEYFNDLSIARTDGRGQAFVELVQQQHPDPDSMLYLERIRFPLPNVMIGASIEDMAAMEQRMPWLRRVPAAWRFISAEPLLGPITFGDDLREIDWLICGGESGPGARPMHPDWARSLRDQCAAAGVPFFFKQWGDHAPIGHIDRGHATDPAEFVWRRVGKKAAGRLLDGIEHNAMPVRA
jgi:protein gp37